ncbi:ceramide kinase [Calliphora vicina]|uniref:ceramide kinase n=1 Tax=Calliphora vicina TaxID=7373 RepID=UPI00325ABA58
MIKSKMVYTHSKTDDILLNNFQIKKKRYKVLLNYDHIVWERLDVKRCQTTNDGNNEKKSSASAVSIATTPATATTAAIQKEVEYEKEQLSQKAAYGCLSNVLHLHDVIRVSKGTTKSASIRNAHKPLESAEELQKQQVTTPTEQYLSIYYGERIVASPTDCNRWHTRRLTLHNNDPYIVAKWYDHLHKLLRKDDAKRVKRLLVFINPYGGRKMGLQIYERHCKQLIQLSGIDASCIITQRANQIRDILMTHDLTPYDAVCCVGGDGTVAEMINGLIGRAMRDQGLDLRQPEYIPKPALPVGIIPAGSTDTIVYSLHGTSDAQTAAIHLVLGQRRGLDICSVRNRDGIVRFCTSVMGYGYLGDVAAKSEKYRWMGTKRYEYTGVRTFLLNRGYEAEIHLLLNDDELDATSSTTTISPPYNDIICHANCQRCRSDAYTSPGDDNEKPTSSNLSIYARQTNDDNNTMKPKQNPLEIDEHSRNFDRNICDKNYTKPMEKQTQIKDLIDSQEPNIKPCSPSSSSSSINMQQQQDQQQKQQPVEQLEENNVIESSRADAKKWRVIRGEFFMITGANITCACTRSPNGISRYCHLGDGHLDVVLVRKTNLFNNIRLVVNTMGRSGDVRNLPFVEVYRTRQFMFKTKSNTWPHDYNSVRGSCQPINETYAEQETTTPDKLYSSWNCDGEVVSDLEITMTSHRQLLDVFMRGPYIYSKPAKNMANKSVFCCCCNS